ncbi:hypothetical protein [Actinoplanes sp. NBRC 103695]|uniref:hypothetical protein n=1 Tax=Actinoplanes sp. NBRC 103695 TaxID=3032202 RepID=UPI0024A57B40|nr:hypothetical protein [Actinoplanes sp. NBRC 103695]GLY94264.1 hypothetical protein Acsp02_15200 [Actinoplanes sp. NBRC 103695]
MTAPLASSILAVLFALAGYAAGRYHQSQPSAGDREDAYQEGFEAATASTFSMAARIASPATPAATPTDLPIAAQTALASSGVPAPAPIPPAGPVLGPAADARGHRTPAAEMRGTHAPAEEASGAHPLPAESHGTHTPTAETRAPHPAATEARGTHTPTAEASGLRILAASGIARAGSDDEDDGASALSPIAGSAVGMPLGHRHTAHGGPRAEGFPAPTPFGHDTTERRGGSVDREHATDRRGALAGRDSSVERRQTSAEHDPAVERRQTSAEHDPAVERRQTSAERDGGIERREAVVEEERGEGAGSGAFFEPVLRDAAADVPGPQVGRRGRHFVPDELVQATTYRLPADRVARAKVPDTIKPPEVGDDESDGSRAPVPQPRSS